jgi:6-phosphogluconolactonase
MSDLVYIGGYGSGISWYARHGAQLSRLDALECPDPSYLIADPARQLLYAVHEQAAGSVSSYAAAPDGALRHLSTQGTHGADPCHLALHDGYLIAANYTSGSVSVHAVGPGGALDPAVDTRQHAGHGPNPERQAGPHAHQVVVAGDLVTVVDLGLDRLVHYRLDAGTGRLAPVGETVAPPGSGPRHAVRHPSGHWYVACELDSTVATFSLQPSALGPLTVTPSAVTPASTVDGVNYPSGIALAGEFLYVGNRGADTIATFRVAPDGTLELAGEVSCGGVWPRQFALVEDLLFVANQRSGTVVALRLDPKTGLPEPTGETVEVPEASCVLLTGWPA